jgi:phospho-N-acetylmuramoyl-pentapeptide-transferase
LLGIPILRKIKIGQSIRLEGPSTHLIKQGTPTMGGIIIMLGFSISFIIVGINKINLSFFDIFSFLFPCYIYLLIGFMDDLIIVIKHNNEGIKPKIKIMFQIIGIVFYYIIFLRNHSTEINLYFLKINLKQFYFLFILLLYVSTTNAVNLTDGLDGLASGLLIICFIGTTTLGLLYQKYDIVLFSGCVVGALLSFLIFNFNPAKIFMGNAGSLMFGSVLATIFVLLEEEMMIIIIGIVFIIETLSVIIQVLYFKITKGKRIFLMAPLHHHYEKKGNSEIVIDLLFWIFALIALFFVLIVIL